MSLPTTINQITELAKEVAILFYEQDEQVFEMENDIDEFVSGSWFGIVQRLHLENVARTNLEILQQHYYEVLYIHTREVAKSRKKYKENTTNLPYIFEMSLEIETNQEAIAAYLYKALSSKLLYDRALEVLPLALFRDLQRTLTHLADIGMLDNMGRTLTEVAQLGVIKKEKEEN